MTIEEILREFDGKKELQECGWKCRGCDGFEARKCKFHNRDIAIKAFFYLKLKEYAVGELEDLLKQKDKHEDKDFGLDTYAVNVTIIKDRIKTLKGENNEKV
ncbi:MAG: hypothetical protein WC900_10035 [Oscillospiraceae bacterium]|jgi:hypothetical protein